MTKLVHSGTTHSTVITGTFKRTKSKRLVFAPAGRQAVERTEVVPRRPARVARMLSLAHHLQNALDQGSARNRAVVARRLGIAESRLSQVLNLLSLAPDIQLSVLQMEAVDGVEPTNEKALRKIAANVRWEEQRKQWTVGAFGG